MFCLLKNRYPKTPTVLQIQEAWFLIYILIELTERELASQSCTIGNLLLRMFHGHVLGPIISNKGIITVAITRFQRILPECTAAVDQVKHPAEK